MYRFVVQALFLGFRFFVWLMRPGFRRFGCMLGFGGRLCFDGGQLLLLALGAVLVCFRLVLLLSLSTFAIKFFLLRELDTTGKQ